MNCHGFCNTGEDLAFADPPKDGPSVPEGLASHSHSHTAETHLAKLGGVVKPER